MDRLVVGDVGFGKDRSRPPCRLHRGHGGMQVRSSRPTTLLARQHYTNFCERFRGFPDRDRPPLPPRHRQGSQGDSRPRRLRARSTSSSARTRCWPKSVEFKKLGLVIVDEEQRFGVTHKERLKALKADVHVLTLTATPIPRTLQMAMSGLRELSVIQTPPSTAGGAHLRHALGSGGDPRGAAARTLSRRAELLRRARVSDLADLEQFLRDEVPEVTSVTAHGQMAPTEVEERMSAFYDRKYDVLLSTTIVESGLDIPSANTLIIHRADKFGLAQLYQLRGRVGRSKTRAYAYFTTRRRGS
jgi:transcription-repair coupling factor (superfamily II helicase)